MKTVINEIKSELFDQKNVRFYVKRDDLIHPYISGNKFRKLKYNLERARKEGHRTLVTFGGAYSNHIYALAAAGAMYGLKTVGVIRGEPYNPLNPTLAFASEKGMKLHYLSRESYQRKYHKSFLNELEKIYGPHYLVPEGGSNVEAVRGCCEIVREIDQEVDVIAVCCGTGGTMAGILAGLDGDKYGVGFPVLKHGEFLKNDISGLVRSYNGREYQNWHLESNYHFGGFARFKMELIDFINDFKKKFGILLDPVYTGKMMY
ncbi:MAG: 1-aminocyclopropane-1-carboxylate deaminase/D-cysteine desulfhydrase, partial [Cyclobacteriaceae bacterium]|nr:1-aminocyclopropane-1-carboxylate deaminase/D-cysteine desulfhydrase [Cyclobacteriaceae bacterium]